MNLKRRVFLKSSTALIGSAVSFPLAGHAQDVPQNAPRDDPDRPRQRLDLVQAFVQAAHSDLPEVRRLLEVDSALLHSSWDWGNGDWEDGLEGASHMGRRDIVEFLLKQGARTNPFCMAMMGRIDVITALIEANPAVCDSRGPHFLTLLFHAGLSSNVDIAELVAANISGEKAWQFNQAMLGAARESSVEMLEWLISNGVTDINETNFFNQNPLDIALARGDESIIALLRSHGAVSATR